MSTVHAGASLLLALRGLAGLLLSTRENKTVEKQATCQQASPSNNRNKDSILHLFLLKNCLLTYILKIVTKEIS